MVVRTLIATCICLSATAAFAEGATPAAPTQADSYITNERSFQVENAAAVLGGETRTAQLSFEPGCAGSLFVAYGKMDGLHSLSKWERIEYCGEVGADVTALAQTMPDGFVPGVHQFIFLLSRTLTGALDDYVMADKMAFWVDGIANAGKDKPHADAATTWVDLVDGKELSAVQGDNALTVPTCTEKSFVFSGDKCGLECQLPEFMEAILHTNENGKADVPFTVEMSMVPKVSGLDEVVKDGTVLAYSISPSQRFFEVRPTGNQAGNVNYFNELVWLQISGGGAVTTNNAAYMVRNNFSITREFVEVNNGDGSRLVLRCDLHDEGFPWIADGFDRSLCKNSTQIFTKEQCNQSFSIGCPSHWNAKYGQKFEAYSVRIYLGVNLSVLQQEANRAVDRLRFGSDEDRPSVAPHSVSFATIPGVWRYHKNEQGAVTISDGYWRLNVKPIVGGEEGDLEIVSVVNGWDGTNRDLNLAAGVICDSGEYYAIKGIAYAAFEGKFTQNLAKDDGRVALALPQGMYYIWSSAFGSCNAMTTQGMILNLKPQPNGDNGLKIGEKAFHNCSECTGELVIGDGVHNIEIGTQSFCGTKFTKVTFSKGILSVPDNMFGYPGSTSGAGSIESIEFPKTMQSLGKNAFSGAAKLTGTMVLPELGSIGDNCFQVAPPGGPGDSLPLDVYFRSEPATLGSWVFSYRNGPSYPNKLRYFMPQEWCDKLLNNGAITLWENVSESGSAQSKQSYREAYPDGITPFGLIKSDYQDLGQRVWVIRWRPPAVGVLIIVR